MKFLSLAIQIKLLSGTFLCYRLSCFSRKWLTPNPFESMDETQYWAERSCGAVYCRLWNVSLCSGRDPNRCMWSLWTYKIELLKKSLFYTVTLT